ncbi:TPA: glycosyltransferase, partial [Enterococcus faecium]|nr:glycosyltransferase [Enterococcus faecium]
MNNKLNQPILISIVTANSDKIFRTLDNFISTVKDETAVKIRIFDNNSLPEYKKRLTEYRKYPYIDIYFHDENSGFGYGHNHNLIASDSRYGIICNPDILVDEETVTALVLLLKEHPECAMLAPKILNEDGTTQHLIREQLAVFDYVLRFVPF